MSVVTGPDNLREEKISLLIRRYEKDLLRTCCIYLRDKDMAQDAVQETFFKAYKALDSFRGESTEKTWLYSIAFNVCRDMRRSAWFRYVDMRVTLDHLPDPVEPASEASTRESSPYTAQAAAPMATAESTGLRKART